MDRHIWVLWKDRAHLFSCVFWPAVCEYNIIQYDYHEIEIQAVQNICLQYTCLWNQTYIAPLVNVVEFGLFTCVIWSAVYC